MINSTEIFGFSVNHGENEAILKDIELLVDAKYSGGIAFMNSHMIYEAKHDASFYAQLQEFTHIFPDGVPLLKSLYWLNGINSERIAGNDLIFSLIKLAFTKKLKLTFYGGSELLRRKIEKRLNSDYQGIQAQLISPPFRDLTSDEREKYINKINDFNPSMVLVGLGCPKQEIWIASHISKIKAPMFGLGGAFALFAGVDTRAPLWMRNLSLEWLYRMALEPGRLWKRYLVTNSYFIYLLLREFWRIRVRGKV
ncbi:MAG: WecB/TagA/CpsF family glycosyltransferase [Bacteroidota bacterium]